MQGISNHTYQDLIQIYRSSSGKPKISANFMSSELEHLLYIIRTVLNLKKVLPHYFSATAPLHKKSDGFSLFKPSAPHDTFINLS